MTHPTDGAALKTLPRVLGLFDASAMVVGSIIGSGIFLKVGNVDQALMAWGFLPIIGVWIFVGLVTLCGSLSLAELAAMYPQAGGPYLYLREAFGRLPAFLWAWTEFAVVKTGSVGALACATAIYLDEFLKPSANAASPLGHYGQMFVAVAIVIGSTIINMVSTRWGATVQNVATIAKISFLTLLIVLPFFMGRIDFKNLTPLWISHPQVVVTATEAPSASTATSNESQSFLTAIGIALMAVFWPYDGWINVAPVAEEIREPQVNISRALGFGVGIVILVYLGANLSYHLVLSVPTVAKSDRLAADLFQSLFGEWGRRFAALGVLCSTFGAATSNLISGPRIYFAAARDHLVPSFLQRIHPHFKTPANSVLIQGSWATILLFVFFFTSTHPKQVFDLITDAVICAGLIFYSLAVSAVYVLRKKRPDALRPYKTWGYPFTPAFMIAAYVLAFIGTLFKQWDRIGWVLCLIVVGTIYYAIVTRLSAPTIERAATNEIT